MNIFNLLSTSQSFIEVSVEGIGTVDLKWIGYVISWIFNLVSDVPGAVAVGVILFTLMLKTFVLPLDIYSRVKMRKQSLLMESMRPEMEKLQKQYASDQQMYNQKVMELQRAHGYNPIGACLPTLISLVIFIVVFQSFSQYSQYANLSSYNDMTKAYCSAVNKYVLREYTLDDESNEYVAADPDKDEYFLIAAIENGESSYTLDVQPHHVNENGALVDADGKELKVYGYFVDYDKFGAYYESEQVGNTLPENWAEMLEEGSNGVTGKNEVVENFVRLGARIEAAKYYEEHKSATSLIWIGNVWYPDSMLNKEVPDYSSFRSTITRAAGSIDANYEESYNEVTHDLAKQKDTYNGYFVLIVLAIGFMFLQQFITMRSQKAASEFSSVDGQGARTNKMMMIIMPVIFGLFSFFYSAAFSIYMIVNTCYSLISTLIINKIVSVRFDKDAENKARKKLQGRTGRKRLK